MNNATFDFAIVGIGVMGSNLLLNLADNGFAVLGYDTNTEKTIALEKQAPPGTTVKGVNSVEELVSKLKVPRKIMMLVPAGKPVDIVIENLVAFIEPGDIVMDGGNSHFTDTLRRLRTLEEKGIHFLGVGISGGEEGARTGPSIMPGGEKAAYEYLKPLFEAIAAKVNGVPCVDYLGKAGAGHYVKMVHNGIEYSIMQLICESYDLLKRVGGLENDELHEVFREWNLGDLQSFLVQITARIFTMKDDKTGNDLVDMILDKAGAKGTGKWTSQDALDLGVPIPSIDAAVTMRNISALQEQRVLAAELYPTTEIKQQANKQEWISHVHDALYFGILMSYTQGLAMLQVASRDLEMDIPLKKVVNVWKGGCIIRSTLLNVFDDVFEENEDLVNLLLHKSIVPLVTKSLPGTRKVIAVAAENGISAAGLMASLNYFNASTASWLPINLLQAQRDFFGAHTYARIDEPGMFHTVWQNEEEEELIKE
jgi:6-phosphogluconate dehydrogenase